MDPFTAMIIGTAASVGGSLIQGVQGYQQGMHEAAIAGQNAQIATDNAARSRLDAARAEEAQRREMRKALGRAAAASAQSGANALGPGTGSFGAVNAQSAKEAELDALNIRYGGEMQAFGDLTQAAQFRAERKAAIRRAKGSAISGVVGAASAGLSGVANYRTAKGRYGATSPTSSPPIKISQQRAPLIKPYYGGR